MSTLRYPNESEEYRKARDALLKDEQELIDQVRAVTQKRRKLPLGGQLKENYTFEWANDGKVGDKVKFSELFGDKDTLVIYSMMYGPSWDNPCLSCTSLVDGFDRNCYQLDKSGAAFVVIAKAAAKKINALAKRRSWTQMPLVSGLHSSFQADYNCQWNDDEEMARTMMNVFVKQDGRIFHFWGSELPTNNVDMVWPYWNLMDMTPQGRPDSPTPPQNFTCEFLETHKR